MHRHIRRSSDLGRKLTVLMCGAACAVAVTACGSSDSSTSASGSGTASSSPAKDSGVVPAPASDQPMLNQVPAKLRPSYEGASTFTTIRPNPYANWTPPKPPWKFCLAESYLKNTFRQQMLASQKDNIVKLQAAGLAKGGLTVLNSNGDVNLYISQVNQLVSSGCNVIFTLPGTPTGYCKAFDNAKDKGVLVFVVNDSTDCESAVSSGQNQYTVQRDSAKWLAEQMGGKGNLLLLSGISGSKVNTARMDVVNAMFKTYPDIDIKGDVEGDWTPTVAKTAILKWLGTHPGKIDAVYDSGAMATAAAQAFKQTGRPAPKQSNFAADCSWLAYWKQNNLTSHSYAEAPRAAVNMAYALAQRMLKGEKPSIGQFLFPLEPIDNNNLDTWYKPSMTIDSTCFGEPPSGYAVDPKFFDPLFKTAK